MVRVSFFFQFCSLLLLSFFFVFFLYNIETINFVCVPFFIWMPLSMLKSVVFQSERKADLMHCMYMLYTTSTSNKQSNLSRWSCYINSTRLHLIYFIFLSNSLIHRLGVSTTATKNTTKTHTHIYTKITNCFLDDRWAFSMSVIDKNVSESTVSMELTIQKSLIQ